MPDNVVDGIWPPYEAFYIESLLHSTSLALRSADEVRSALAAGRKCDPSSQEWQDCALRIISGVQTVVVLSRAQRLKSALEVSEESPLRSRNLRNRLKHFDELLDDFCGDLTAGLILPTYVGPIGEESGVPTYLFRAYYTDVAVFEILGHRFELQPHPPE